MKSYLKMDILPKKIRKFIDNEELVEIHIGESLSEVIYIPNKKAYLKITPADFAYLALNEYKMYNWLKGKLPVPKVILYEKDIDYHYLIISEVEGESLYDADISDKERVKLFAEGLKKVHSVNIKNCPVVFTTKEVVNRIKKSVEYNIFTIGNHQRINNILDELIVNEPHYEPVLIHGDYAMVNVLVKDNKLSGFIDLSESGVYSKYKDIVHALIDLDYLGYSKYKDYFLKIYGIELESKLYDFFYELDFG